MSKRIPKADLEAVMDSAGYTEREKCRLRRANEEPAKTKGHGAPAEARISFGDAGL